MTKYVLQNHGRYTFRRPSVKPMIRRPSKSFTSCGADYLSSHQIFDVVFWILRTSNQKSQVSFNKSSPYPIRLPYCCQLHGWSIPWVLQQSLFTSTHSFARPFRNLCHLSNPISNPHTHPSISLCLVNRASMAFFPHLPGFRWYLVIQTAPTDP